MVIVFCNNCGSEDVCLDSTEKYLVCNSCNNREYIRDLDIGLTASTYGANNGGNISTL